MNALGRQANARLYTCTRTRTGARAQRFLFETSTSILFIWLYFWPTLSLNKCMRTLFIWHAATESRPCTFHLRSGGWIIKHPQESSFWLFLRFFSWNRDVEAHYSKGDSGLACVRLKQKAGADHSRWKSGSNECVEADTQKSDANTDGLVSNRDGGGEGVAVSGASKNADWQQRWIGIQMFVWRQKKKKKIRCVFKLSPSEAPPTTSHHSTYTSI